MPEDTNKDAIAGLIKVIESMQKKMSLLQAASIATQTALLSTLTLGANRAKVAQDLRNIASRYEELAIAHPLSDEDIAESVQALLALASKLD
jgi:hypothetical protein